MVVERGKRKLIFRDHTPTWAALKVVRKEYTLDLKTAGPIDREVFVQIAPEALAAADAPKTPAPKAA